MKPLVRLIVTHASLLIPSFGLLSVWGFLTWYSYQMPQEWPGLAALACSYLLWLAVITRQHIPPIWILWGTAISLRALAGSAAPLYENDWIRYLWDGWQFLQTGMPYDRPPLDAFTDPAAEQVFGALLNDMNYPEWPTIYGPGGQTAFALSAWIAPAQLWAWKIIIALHEFGCLLLLWRLLEPRQWLVYAWCPLVLHTVWGNAHLDGIAVFWLVLGMFFLKQQRGNMAALACGIAIACRLHAIPLVIAYGIWRRDWLFTFTSLGVATIWYVPFFFAGSWAGLDVSKDFLTTWHVNALLYYPLTIIIPEQAARWLLGSISLIICAWLCLKKNTPSAVWHRGDLLYGFLLLGGAAFNPWYALWMLPFIARYREPWCIALLGAAACGYAINGNISATADHPFAQPAWVIGIQWSCLSAGLLGSWVLRRPRVAE